LLICLFVYSARVQAQATLPLTVAPARQELIVNPGEQTAVNVRFYNLGDSPLSGIIKVADFLVEEKEGTPKIIEDFSQAPPRFAASNWVTLPYDRMTIAVGDKVSLQAKIKVPFRAHPGGRYLAIYFEPGGAVPQAVGSAKEAGVGVASRVAGLVYLKVAGPTREAALVSRFFAKNFWEYGPVEVETEILNRGDLHIRPKGVVSLTNIFGGLVDQQKLKEQNIFPDTLRSFKNSLGGKWLVGRYRLDFSAAYGEQGRALTAAFYVWVFPWKVALIITLSLIIIILLARHLYKTILVKEATLEEEIKQEKEEIKKLREALKKKSD
jgi:hypothetical protein